ACATPTSASDRLIASRCTTTSTGAWAAPARCSIAPHRWWSASRTGNNDRGDDMSGWKKLSAAVALAVASGAGWSAVGEQEAARLGKDLTPVGAEKAGNKDGTIPAWTGGITRSPAGWKPGDPRVDPFKDDKPLFSIDASNVDKYKDKLSEGQQTLIRTLKGYRMDVYPTR